MQFYFAVVLQNRIYIHISHDGGGKKNEVICPKSRSIEWMEMKRLR